MAKERDGEHYPTVQEWVAEQLPKLLRTITEDTWDEIWAILN